MILFPSSQNKKENTHKHILAIFPMNPYLFFSRGFGSSDVLLPSSQFLTIKGKLLSESLLSWKGELCFLILPSTHAALQTAAISSAGLAGLSRNFLSSAQVSKRVCWENTFLTTSVACAASHSTLFRRSQLFQALDNAH